MIQNIHIMIVHKIMTANDTLIILSTVKVLLIRLSSDSSPVSEVVVVELTHLVIVINPAEYTHRNAEHDGDIVIERLRQRSVSNLNF